MKRNGASLALFALAAVLQVSLLSLADSAVSQSFPYRFYYYETRWVGQSPTIDDFIVTSAQEDTGVTPPTLQGVFADWSVGLDPSSSNTAAVLDAGYHKRIPNAFYPTGQLVIGKASSIRVYCPVNWDRLYGLPFIHLARQDLPGPTWPNPAQSDNTVVLNSIATASRNPVQAMDIACGMSVTGVSITQTNFLITAEQLSGQVWIVAYALTDPWGTIVAPYPVNGHPTGITGSCAGLVTSPGRVDTATGEHTLNEIVFVTQGAAPQNNNLVVHALTFDVVSLSFGTLDVSSSYSVPHTLSTVAGHLPAGIWIAQKDPMASPLVRSHHVGISLPNPTAPLTSTGSLTILPGSVAGQPRIPAVVTTLVGGGPISHVPWGHNPGGTMFGGPAYHLFGANGGGASGPGPTGFYVVTPGVSWGGQLSTVIFGVDGLGTIAGPFGFPYWVYPQNATPNGTPLAHPALISQNGSTALRKGALWAPYSVGSNFAIDLVEGAPTLRTTFTTVTHMIASPLPTQYKNFWNDSLLWPLPKTFPLWPHPSWAGTQVILPDQKTNFKAEYGMYITGY